MTVKPLTLRHVSHSFGGVEVLRDLSIEVAHAEAVAILGPSGCGKTTLLKILSGYYKASAGVVVRRGPTRMLHQHDGLLPWLTAAENICLGLRRLRDAAERAWQLRELLELIRLRDFADFYPHQLSGGMRQRVELARSLAGDASVLLMDEPFTSLDHQTRVQMRAELTRILAHRPMTVVLVTHDVTEAVQFADRIVLLSERPARIVEELILGQQRPRDAAHPALADAVQYIFRRLDARPGAPAPPREFAASGRARASAARGG